VPEIKAAELSKWITAQLREDTEIVRKAALDTCLWGEREAVRKTNEVEAVDQGLFKLSWTHGSMKGGAELRNDAPYAGVIERGRRPGRPGPPLWPILAWVQRKFGKKVKAKTDARRKIALANAKSLSGELRAAGKGKAHRAAVSAAYKAAKAQIREDISLDYGTELYSIALGVQRKIHVKGTKPRWILRDTFNKMGPRFKKEAIRRLRSKYK
jgi:hypothetical protein